MDDFGKNISMIMFLAIILILFTLSSVVVFMHDADILESHHENAKFQYFIESSDLTNQENYDLVKSICNETFSNQSIYDELYATKIPFWNVQEHMEFEINKCERNCIGWD